MLGISLMVGMAAAPLLAACGGNPTTVTPIAVDAGPDAADAAADAKLDAPSTSDAGDAATTADAGTADQ